MQSNEKILIVERQVNTEMYEALTTTLAALKDIVRQLPTDERLADYNLDFAELAEAKAQDALDKVNQKEVVS